MLILAIWVVGVIDFHNPLGDQNVSMSVSYTAKHLLRIGGRGLALFVPVYIFMKLNNPQLYLGVGLGAGLATFGDGAFQWCLHLIHYL